MYFRIIMLALLGLDITITSRWEIRELLDDSILPVGSGGKDSDISLP